MQVSHSYYSFINYAMILEQKHECKHSSVKIPAMG